MIVGGVYNVVYRNGNFIGICIKNTRNVIDNIAVELNFLKKLNNILRISRLKGYINISKRNKMYYLREKSNRKSNFRLVSVVGFYSSDILELNLGLVVLISITTLVVAGLIGGSGSYFFPDGASNPEKDWKYYLEKVLIGVGLSIAVIGMAYGLGLEQAEQSTLETIKDSSSSKGLDTNSMRIDEFDTLDRLSQTKIMAKVRLDRGSNDLLYLKMKLLRKKIK